MNTPISSKLCLQVVALIGLLFLPSSGYATPLYRSMDGWGNNSENPDWGAAGTPLVRMHEPRYGDNQSTPANSTGANPRDISNAVFAQDRSIPNEYNASSFLWQWGQFLDHDLSLSHQTGEAMPITVPTGDPYFDPFGTGTREIGFTRSTYDPHSSPREQMNSITAYIDASQVYGSSDAEAKALRSFEGGRMRITDDGLMPINPATGEFLAGDERATEQSGLTAMHTLFVREHNRIADRLSIEHPDWDDEKLFQESRKLVAAEIQVITYNEFLPALLGENALPEYQGYRPDVSPQIANEFSTAAFRVGHTMLPTELLRFDENWQEVPEGHLALRNAFHDPSKVLNEGGIDPVLRGLLMQPAQQIDAFIIDDVRNFLFGPPGAGGFDLIALNIQRGRDHGLPGYNELRTELGLAPITGFDSDIFIPGVGERLASVYGSVDEIDLWVGGLAEQHLDGAMLGELFHHIFVDQFTRLRDGDFFWYANYLTLGELFDVEQITLADIIRWNTGIHDIPGNVFVTPTEVPEPGTLLLLGGGLAAALRRRKTHERNSKL